jgi:transposase
MQPARKAYPSDVSDEEWAFVAPYLALLPVEAPQRRHDLREVFNGLRFVVKCGAPWRWMPHDFPPWAIVYQQTQRWLQAGVFETMVHDLRLLLRDHAGRKARPTAAIFDSRTLQSSPESGHRAGWDGAKRKEGSKIHIAVDTLGHLLAAHVTPADEQDRAQVEALAATVQQVTAQSVELVYVDQGYSGQDPAEAAQEHAIRLEVVKHTDAASCSCPDAGWWNAASPGQPASAASRATTNACQRPSEACTSSPLPASCSIRSHLYSLLVPSSL